MPKHFDCKTMMVTLRGQIPQQVPYSYSMPEKYRATVVERLGNLPENIFHTEPWYQLALIRYEGTELWDTEEQLYTQSPDEFEMLRERFSRFLPKDLPEGSRINAYGVVTYHPEGMGGHLRKIINPLANISRTEDLESYPFPDGREEWRWEGVADRIKRSREDHFAVMGGVPLILEDANFMRGMEQNLVDMSEENEVARWIFGKLQADRLSQAKRFAQLGVDMIGFGDHLASQRGALFSRKMFRRWIMKTYEPIVDAARSIKPDLVFAWHTDGKNDDFIYEDLLSIGVSIFNPVESDCENPWQLKERYGQRMVLWGTLSKLEMENASPQEVRAAVKDRINLARQHGGIILGFPGSSRVPFENYLAYNLAAEELGRI